MEGEGEGNFERNFLMTLRIFQTFSCYLSNSALKTHVECMAWACKAWTQTRLKLICSLNR
jgi:hypothetical protein